MRPIYEIMFGFLLTVIMLIIHSAGMYLVMHKFELNWPKYLNERSEIRRQFYFGRLVALMLLTHIFEIFIIAVVLFEIHAFQDLRTAFYFTGETYTTVGFGDVLLPTGWRQLALFTAPSWTWKTISTVTVRASSNSSCIFPRKSSVSAFSNALMTRTRTGNSASRILGNGNSGNSTCMPTKNAWAPPVRIMRLGMSSQPTTRRMRG